ncbi:hypothetical protein MKZ38_001532 [Zalerion maritima]|uniref:Uncharacterized protein n=1 Tax=Zalerion maritima TaxID=339359 RepID=A0AAD5RXT8_9PEZI|nr:hypothetical protein MKZ38_001532 [Zalerion maritima]
MFKYCACRIPITIDSSWYKKTRGELLVECEDHQLTYAGAQKGVLLARLSLHALSYPITPKAEHFVVFLWGHDLPELRNTTYSMGLLMDGYKYEYIVVILDHIHKPKPKSKPTPKAQIKNKPRASIHIQSLLPVSEHWRTVGYLFELMIYCHHPSGKPGDSFNNSTHFWGLLLRTADKRPWDNSWGQVSLPEPRRRRTGGHSSKTNPTVAARQRSSLAQDSRSLTNPFALSKEDQGGPPMSLSTFKAPNSLPHATSTTTPVELEQPVVKPPRSMKAQDGLVELPTDPRVPKLPGVQGGRDRRRRLEGRVDDALSDAMKSLRF